MRREHKLFLWAILISCFVVGCSDETEDTSEETADVTVSEPVNYGECQSKADCYVDATPSTSCFEFACVAAENAEDGNVCAEIPKGINTPCESDSCSSDETCTQCGCDGAGECQAQAAFDGTPCGSIDGCTGQYCQAGECVEETKDCDDDNPCTADNCEDGECTYTNFEGEPCDDGDNCTEDDVCSAGMCMGTPGVCSCEEDADCPAIENLCDGSYSCAEGSCVLVALVLDCTSDNPCEVGACDPATGECAFTALADGETCDDGVECTTEDTCVAGVCGGIQGTVEICDDGIDNDCDEIADCKDSDCEPEEVCDSVDGGEATEEEGGEVAPEEDGGEATEEEGGEVAPEEEGGEVAPEEEGGEVAPEEEGGEVAPEEEGGEVAPEEEGGEVAPEEGGEVAPEEEGGEVAPEEEGGEVAPEEEGGEVTVEEEGGEATEEEGGEVTVEEEGGEATEEEGGEVTVEEEGGEATEEEGGEVTVEEEGGEATEEEGGEATVEEGGEATVEVVGCTDENAENFDPTATVDDGSCTYVVTFQLDAGCSGIDTAEGVFFNSAETGWCGDCDPMTLDEAKGLWTYQASLPAGEFEYKYRIGPTWEVLDATLDSACTTVSGDNGQFTNRILIVLGETLVAPVAFGSCEGCPAASSDEGGGEEEGGEGEEGASEEGGEGEPPSEGGDTEPSEGGGETLANLFFSEIAEGSGSNKYLEIYNGGSTEASLEDYALGYCTNGCDVEGEFDNFADFPAPAGQIGPGQVIVVCHGSADPAIQALCNFTNSKLSNGDDTFAIVHTATGTVLDIFGNTGTADPDPFTVCGQEGAAKDNTLVRECSVTSGTPVYEPNGMTCEWSITGKDNWADLGQHCP